MVQRVEPFEPIAGVIFDLDGTLVDSKLDFDAIRLEIGVPEGRAILETMAHMTPEDSARAWTILDAHEMRGAATATLMPGVAAFLDRLNAANIPTAILTRNSRAALELTCGRLGIAASHFIAREDAPPKPDPTGLLQVCRAWGVRPEQTAIVGDYHFDLDCGRNAGTRTVLYLGGRDPATLPYATRADLWLECFTRPEPMFGWLGW
ncbi:MAG TPA: HAD family hydrolase [Pirellulales bacterium]